MILKTKKKKPTHIQEQPSCSLIINKKLVPASNKIGTFFPKVDLSEWCKKWWLTEGFYPCPDCKKSRTIDTPFISKGMRGIKSSHCIYCGSKKIRVQYTYIDEMEHDLADLIFR